MKLYYIFIPLGVLVILTALLNPIYTDEVCYLNLLGRFHKTFPEKVYLFPHCPDGFTVPVPFLLKPAALIFSLLSTPIKWFVSLRLANFALVASMFVILWVEMKRHSTSARPGFLYLMSFALSGLIPFLITIARPETISAFLVLLIAIFFKTSPNLSLFKLILLSILTSLLAWIHPANLVFSPIIALSVWRVSPNAPWVRATFYLIIFVTFVMGIDMHRMSMSCNESPKIAEFFSKYSNNLAAGDTETPSASISMIYSSMTRVFDFTPYLLSTLPQADYPFGIAPSLKEDAKGILSNILTLCSLTVIIIFTFDLTIRFVATVGKSFKARSFSSSTLASVALLISLVGINMLYPHKYPYRSTSVFWILALSYVLMPLSPTYFYSRAPIKWIYISSSTISMILLLALHGPQITSSLDSQVLQERPLSTGIFSDLALSKELNEAKAECGLDQEPNTDLTIVTDLVTQFSTQEFSRVVLTDYVTSPFFGIADQGLEKAKIDRLFTRCSSLPEDIEAMTTRVGSFCCWSLPSPADKEISVRSN